MTLTATRFCTPTSSLARLDRSLTSSSSRKGGLTTAALLIGAASFMAAALLPSAARAEDAPTTEAEATSDDDAEEARPKMSLTVAPPGPALQRKAYMHEGFYMRFSVGPGWMYTDLNSSDGSGPSVDAHAFSLGADLLIGGSPSPGIAMGGGVLANLGFGADFTEGGTSLGNGTVFHFLAGPFFDAFPNDKEGFHLGTLLGFAGMAQTASIAGLSDSGFGGGAGAWLGYNAWVAPEWSAGFDLRATGGYMAGDSLEVGIFTVTGMVTILNH